MKPYLLSFIYLLFPVLLWAQTNITPIPGWKLENIGGWYKFTPPTGNFEYDIMSLETSGVNNLTDWVKTFSIKDLQASGYSAPLASNPPLTKYIQSILTYSVIVTDQQNVKWGIMYVAYSRPDNAIRYGKVIWQPGKPGDALNTAARHFATLMKQEIGQTQAKNNTTSTQSEVKSTPAATSTSSPITTPGKGLSPADIRGLVIHSESSIGVGGMMIIVYKPYILLKNGTMYEHPEISPYDLDVAQSRQSEPEKWGTWKLDGKTLTINHGTKTGVSQTVNHWISGWSWAEPAVKGEKITGSYSTISGGGNTAFGGGAITVSSKFITFNNKGQFTYESTGGGSYNGAGGGVSAYSTKNTSGTYTFDGYSLQLSFNNGKVLRQCFYFYGDDKEVFGIGNHPYTKSK